MTDLPTGPFDVTPTIIHGDVVATLRSLPDRSAHCVAFSPPFWGMRSYSVCGCSLDYSRGEEPHPMPRLADGPLHRRLPDPNCEWCHGTGEIPGQEVLWGGDGSCEQTLGPPNQFIGGGKPPDQTGGVRWQHTGKGESGHFKPGHEWTETPPRRPRKIADATSGIERASIGGRNHEARGGKRCVKCGGWFGQLGLEATPDEYVVHLVGAVFPEIRRVLRSDGTCWMELMDTYVTHPAGVTGEKRWKASTLNNRDLSGHEQAGLMDKRAPGLREKSLALVPDRVALALADAGWIVRSRMVWDKRNPMPESTKDRPTTSHSYVFMLVPEPNYFFDQDGVREEQTGNAHPRGNGVTPKSAPEGSDVRAKVSWHASTTGVIVPGGRNLRSVLRISPQPFPGAHFATWPEALAEILIRASTSDAGCCPECGAQYRRVVDAGPPDEEWRRASGADASGGYSGQAVKSYDGTGAQNASDVKRRILAGMVEKRTVGWTPTCGCQKDPCDRCGREWIHRVVHRVVSSMNIRVRDSKKGILDGKSGIGGEAADATDAEVVGYGDEGYALVEVLAAWPACGCRRPVPATVVDPFAGSGTTLLVARRLGRRSVGIELNPAYVAMARERFDAAHPALERFAEAP